MNVLICDNCIQQAFQCEKMLLRLAKRHGVRVKVYTYKSGEALLFQIEDNLASIDLVYMDINMPGIDGVSTALKLRELGFSGDIIFYTASPEYAISGYDVSALHYIVKGQTSDKKFEEIFLRAHEKKKRRECEVIILTCAGESRCIPLEAIRYFEIQQRILTVHYEANTFEFYSTIRQMEEQLFQKGFLRTHKSYLVNKHYVRSISVNNLILDTDETLPVGKRYYTDCLRALGVNGG